MRLYQGCSVGVGVMSEPYTIRILVPEGDGVSFQSEREDDPE